MAKIEKLCARFILLGRARDRRRRRRQTILWGHVRLDRCGQSDASRRYTIFQSDGNDAAAVYEAPPETPTNWAVYFSVTDLQASAAQIEPLGARFSWGRWMSASPAVWWWLRIRRAPTFRSGKPNGRSERPMADP